MNTLHHPERKNFQIDRIILFTDAVFAIAITLLIIEIKVPEIPENGTDADFLRGLLSLLPKFVGFLISFFMIGLYWIIHHNIFGFVINYTSKLIWLNLFFLFSIVLMPFTTAVYSEFSMEESYLKLILPYAVYVANICLIGIMNFLLLRYVLDRKNGVAEHLPPPELIKLSKKRALAIPSIFLTSLVLTYFWPAFGRSFLFVIPIVMKFLKPKKTDLKTHTA